MTCRIAAVPTTLCDLEGHSSIASLSKLDFRSAVDNAGHSLVDSVLYYRVAVCGNCLHIQYYQH